MRTCQHFLSILVSRLTKRRNYNLHWNCKVSVCSPMDASPFRLQIANQDHRMPGSSYRAGSGRRHCAPLSLYLHYVRVPVSRMRAGQARLCPLYPSSLLRGAMLFHLPNVYVHQRVVVLGEALTGSSSTHLYTYFSFCRLVTSVIHIYLSLLLGRDDLTEGN